MPSIAIMCLTESGGTSIQPTTTTSLEPLFDDCECMAEEHLKDNTPLPQSVVTNNGKY
jgi:hypothetical protein